MGWQTSGKPAVLDETPPDNGLSLREGEDDCPIRVEHVVSRADRLDGVAPTEVAPHHPLTAGSILAVAEVQALLDRLVVRLPGRLQHRSGCPRLEARVLHRPCHQCVPFVQRRAHIRL